MGIGSLVGASAVTDPRAAQPAEPPRQAWLVVRFSKGRGGARATVAAATVDGSGSGSGGVDALPDVIGSDASGDDSPSVAAPSRGARRSVSRASGASRSGRQRRHGRGDQRGREGPEFAGDDEDDPPA